MPGDLAVLVRKRGILKQKLTILKKFVAQFISSQDHVGLTVDDKAITELQLRSDTYESLLVEFNEVQTSLEESCESGDLEDHFVERENFDLAYFQVFSQIKNLLGPTQALSQVSRASSPTHSVAPSSDGSVARNNISSTTQAVVQQAINNPITNNNPEVNSAVISDQNIHLQGVKLPTIKLPVFKGNYESWLEFKDTFNSLIHCNAQINDVQKFHYLRASLEGSATRVIQSLEFSAANYRNAWELLCNRYDNQRLLVHNHVKALFSLDPITKESPYQIRQLVDTVSKHLRALSTLNLPTDHWDILIIYLITSKLDKNTLRDWEEYKLSSDLPNLEEMNQFLKSKADLLETLSINTRDTGQFQNKNSKHGSYSGLVMQCYNCKGSHSIYKCKEFLKLDIVKRQDRIKALKLCFNCIRSLDHTANDCLSGSCKFCKQKHNSLLHLQENTSSQSSSQVNLSSFSSNSNNISQVLLSTAVVRIQDVNGKFHLCRCLLDSGATSNFITEQLCTKLGVSVKAAHVSIVGVNHSVSKVNKMCSVCIHSQHSNYKTSLSCFVLNRITDNIPNQVLDSSVLNIPDNIKLADQEFYCPKEIDLLIGAGLFWDIIKEGKIKLGKQLPIIQNTTLGWIITGPFQESSSKVYAHFVTCNEDDQLKRFWEVEECPKTMPLSADEKECEDIFLRDLQRDNEGRFIVKFPLKHSPKLLGDTKASATKRFLTLERKLESNPSLKAQYHNFIQEYISLGHMTKVSSDELNDTMVCYYFPHHSVVKTSLTTQLRVVFDGSHKSSSGVSLNDLQFIGPKVQNDIFEILIRFRQYKYVVSADVQKMYRMISMHPEHRPLQRIIWRNKPEDELEIYELNTVTYGTAAAPYMAIRCLNQLALDNIANHPVSSQVILRDFYVDDLLTSADSVEDLSQICKDISKILRSGCFELRKWISNDPSIIQGLCSPDTSNGILCLNKNESSKTLGIQWVSRADLLTFKISESFFPSSITKRHMLSGIAQIYDPLGLLSPVTILAKIMIQGLWSLHISWDDTVPQEVSDNWVYFRNQLLKLNSLNIPRHVTLHKPESVQLHGFCDSSQSAFGACIYLRSVNKQGESQVRLLCAKTKVAPLKTLSIPRLELCGAVLLSRLAHQVLQAITIDVKSYYWSDSQIVLAWLRTTPNLLNVFVANRVSEIQNLTNAQDWHHVSTRHNPADLASRGIYPDSLLTADLWWSGPPWLSQHELTWPTMSVDHLHSLEVPEFKKQCFTVQTIKSNNIEFPFARFSNFVRLQRTVSYCKRFVNNCKVPKSQRQTDILQVSEINNATKALVKVVQSSHFLSEISLLTSNKLLPKSHNLAKLSPFVDSEGLLRVGGRLQCSTFQFDVKHPYLLPAKHHFTDLLFDNEHKRLLHAGPRMLLASVRQTYWPINGRNIARKTVHKCVTCYRYNPHAMQPLMGGLPRARVSQSLPFQVCGVDYAGPFLLKESKLRRAKLYKCYVCLFVCFSVKAVHVELASDLTTESFLAAFRRFCSRRGKPDTIYSDNGTNFVGAKNELEALGNFLQKNQKYLSEQASKDNVTWSFIPPHSPHFGGLWEAGVKSVKYHLKRVLGNTALTYEEFYTLLTQVEATLNSRPLTPLSSTPNDLESLCPSHFLIGRTAVSLPDPSLQHLKQNQLSRYQLLQQMYQHFWQRWSTEYISELQEKVKWKSNNCKLSIGTLVLIKEDHLPPNKWLLGRVLNLHPGPDGISRVATVFTSKGETRRAIVKLCPLPNQQLEEEK